MIEVLSRVLPFFAIILVGYGAGRMRFLSEEGTAALTRFVFYFPLSAMLFRFTSNLSLPQVFDPQFMLAYVSAGLLLYVIACAVALSRRVPLAEASMEALVAVSGNTGFLGVPMLVAILGPMAAGPVLTVVSIDLIVFSSLFILMITIARKGTITPGIVRDIAVGLAKNPMIVSMIAGLIWSAAFHEVPQPVNDFMTVLGGAATPGALFAIGASLASKSAERMEVAIWLSACKLLLHPALVALMALAVYSVDPFKAHVMIAAASLPVAGNVYILAQHYRVAPLRVSASILISTLVSVATLSLVLAWATPG